MNTSLRFSTLVTAIVLSCSQGIASVATHSTDMRETVFRAYVRGTGERIHNSWEECDNSAAVAKVFFLLRRDGSIVQTKLQESSGIKSVDQNALDAIRRSTPMEPMKFSLAPNQGVGFLVSFSPALARRDFKKSVTAWICDAESGVEVSVVNPSWIKNEQDKVRNYLAQRSDRLYGVDLVQVKETF